MESDRSFALAVSRLSERLQRILLRLPVQETAGIRELRIRAGAPLCVITNDGVRFLTSGGLRAMCTPESVIIGKRELEDIVQRMCAYSVHSCKEAIDHGFLTLPGGHRVGIAGTASVESGRITAVREISCLAVRIARQISGAADAVFPFTENGTRSLILAGPPCSGKTTVMRDLARQLSGVERGCCQKVVLCDERGELAAVSGGLPQMQLGLNCDVLNGYPKTCGIEIALRSFSPEYLICDEVASAEEVQAVMLGLNSGVRFALSLHAENAAALRRKPLLRSLLQTGAFSSVCLLSAQPVGQVEAVFSPEDLLG